MDFPVLVTTIATLPYHIWGSQRQEIGENLPSGVTDRKTPKYCSQIVKENLEGGHRNTNPTGVLIFP